MSFVRITQLYLKMNFVKNPRSYAAKIFANQLKILQENSRKEGSVKKS